MPAGSGRRTHVSGLSQLPQPSTFMGSPRALEPGSTITVTVALKPAAQAFTVMVPAVAVEYE